MTEETTVDARSHEVTELTAEVVSAYVSNNPVSAADLPGLIDSIHKALNGLDETKKAEPQAEPAVKPSRSVKQDHIVCLECGKKFKSLKRHIGADHGLTPEDYRAKWGLAADYPMVAPDYAEKRSKLAKTMGLGRKPDPKAAKKAK